MGAPLASIRCVRWLAPAGHARRSPIHAVAALRNTRRAGPIARAHHPIRRVVRVTCWVVGAAGGLAGAGIGFGAGLGWLLGGGSALSSGLPEVASAQPVAVPEPSSFVLFIIPALALIAIRHATRSPSVGRGVPRPNGGRPKRVSP